MSNPLRSLAHTLAALTGNCGDFHDIWERAAEPGGGERWLGEWRSEVNGHNGQLRCVLRREAGEFAVWFHARYAKWLRVCYRTTLKATAEGDGWRLEGGTDLGALAGGVYTYRGKLTEGRFHCRYECRYDYGTFEMRPVK